MFVFVAFMLVAAFSFVAAKAGDNETEVTADKAVKNMTYGACVSDAAKIKNDCYGTVKAALANCTAPAEITYADKKACKVTYKKDKKQCKTDFKSTKKTECGKIKATFMEKLRYSFA